MDNFKIKFMLDATYNMFKADYLSGERKDVVKADAKMLWTIYLQLGLFDFETSQKCLGLIIDGNFEEVNKIFKMAIASFENA